YWNLYGSLVSSTVRNVKSTSVSIRARPSSSIVNILPPAPGFRAVPSQAAAIALPSPSAPPNAAIPTANDPIAGKNQELPRPPPVSAPCAIAVPTTVNVKSADNTNNFSRTISPPEVQRTRMPIHFIDGFGSVVCLPHS